MTSSTRRWLLGLVALGGASVFGIRSLASHPAKEVRPPAAVVEKETVEEPSAAAAEPSPVPETPEPQRAEPARVVRREPEPPAESDEEHLSAALQAPIVKAVRARYASTLERRDAMVRELENSGPSREPWTADARATFEQWRAASASEGKTVHVDATRCFRAGCSVVATFPDDASFHLADARTSSLALGWKGAWMQTPAERTPTGEVQLTWMLLRPDAL